MSVNKQPNALTSKQNQKQTAHTKSKKKPQNSTGNQKQDKKAAIVQKSSLVAKSANTEFIIHSAGKNIVTRKPEPAVLLKSRNITPVTKKLQPKSILSAKATAPLKIIRDTKIGERKVTLLY